MIMRKIITVRVKTLFVSVVILSAAGSLANVAQPLLLQSLLDIIIAADFTRVANILFKFVLAIISVIFIHWVQSRLLSKYKFNITSNLRRYIEQNILYSPVTQFKKNNRQEYISIFNNNLSNVIDQYYMLAPYIFFQLLSLGIYFYVVFSINTVFLLIILFANLSTLLFPKLYTARLQKYKEQALKGFRRYNVGLGDIIFGFNTIRLFNVQNEALNTLHDVSTDHLNKQLRFELKVINIDTLLGALPLIGYCSIIVYGIYAISINSITIGGLVAALQLSDMLSAPVNKLAAALLTFFTTSKIKEEILDLNTSEESEQAIDRLEGTIKEIAFENVSFEYENGKSVIRGLSISFPANSKTLIWGPNGSGKSTIVKLLTKDCLDYSGSIKVNGKELKLLKQDSLFQRMGVVPQSIYLFNDSLKNNIILYRVFTDEQVQNVINKLNLQHLLSFQDYSDSMENISGGEKQKIAIARALLHQASVIILDEALSQVDKESSAALEKELLAKDNQILIHIAHKLNKSLTIKYDQIIVFSAEGKVQVLKGRLKREFLAEVVS